MAPVHQYGSVGIAAREAADAAPKPKRTITVFVGDQPGVVVQERPPKASKPVSLNAVAKALADAVQAPRQAQEDTVAAAREALSPVVARAKQIINDLAKLESEHGDSLAALAQTDYATLRRRGVPETLISPLFVAITAAREQFTLGPLAEVEDRVRGLGPEHLTNRILFAECGLPSGFLPGGIRDIELTVLYSAGKPARVTELVETIAALVDQINRRIETADAADLKNASMSMPTDTVLRPAAEPMDDDGGI